jgi:ABC-type bacteriocin/lantibiotic exporter with double-glycine peptidase domain
VARAILGSPAVLVLDEAIDGLDPRDREPLLDALLAPERPWTAILTSNDPAIHARCDLVFALEDGRAIRTTPTRARGER